MIIKRRVKRGFVAIAAMLALANCTQMEPNRSARVGPDGGESLRLLLKSAAQDDTAATKWNAEVDYVDQIVDSGDLSRAVAADMADDPGFATLKRSFGEGVVQPFVGVGFGAAQTQLANAARDSLALKGVIGTSMKLDERLDAFVEYGYSRASGGTVASDDAHGLSFGLRIAIF